jgi:GxxExxY protein
MKRGELIADELTHSIIGAFYEAYRSLGFGFLEHVFVAAMERELRHRGHRVEREIGIQIMYKGEHLCSQRLDMLVDDKVILEIKSSVLLPPTAIRQLHNYLRATNIEVGLLLHFGPKPKFYRQICTNDYKITVSDPSRFAPVRLPDS